jgi:DNA-binding transcriptional ArsR family regulator
MTMANLELLLHPVRLRILRIMIDGVPRTASMLRQLLADVPSATLYRHIGILREADALEVIDERRVRGATERTFAVRREQLAIGDNTRALMTPDDHQRAFLAFVSGLIDDLDRHLGVATERSSVGRLTYQQTAVWLTDKEHDRMLTSLKETITVAESTAPRDQQRRHSVAIISIPTISPGVEQIADDVAGKTPVERRRR